MFELLEKYHGFKGKNELLAGIREAATLDAEDAVNKDVHLLYERRGEQVTALHKVLNSLYGYYRIQHD